MAGPNQNNTFRITLSTGNLTSNNVVINPLETRLGYPHGVRFANTYVVSSPNPQEPTYPLTISNTGIIQNDTIFKTIIDFDSITVGSQSVVISNDIFVPMLTVGGIDFGGGTFGGIVSTQFFTANGTWFKPNGLTGNEQVLVMMWAGGGGGFGNSLFSIGGGGGACLIGMIPISQCNASCNVYVGLGGAGATTGGTTTQGQNTTFWYTASSSLNACGGGGGWGNATLSVSGGGGGLLSMGAAPSGTGGTGGEPLGGAPANIGGASLYGGGGGSNSTSIFEGGVSIFGGGGGSTTGTGGASIFGGGGGADVGGNGGGPSVFGGDGGRASDGTIPGGAGGGFFNAYNGARGEVRIWVIR